MDANKKQPQSAAGDTPSAATGPVSPAGGGVPTSRGPTELPSFGESGATGPKAADMDRGPLASGWVGDAGDSAGQQTATHYSAALQFGITIIVFAGAGWMLDRWLGTLPWLLLLMVALGFAGGLISLVRRLPSQAARAKLKPPPPTDGGV